MHRERRPSPPPPSRLTPPATPASHSLSATPSAPCSAYPPALVPLTVGVIRGDVPDAGEDRRQRRRPPPAVHRTDQGHRFRWPGRRHPMELREIPRRPRRRGAQSVSAPDGT